MAGYANGKETQNQHTQQLYGDVEQGGSHHECIF